MNKEMLIKGVIEETGLSHRDNCNKENVSNIVSAVFDVIKNAMAEGDEVTVYNFGAFKTKVRKGGTVTLNFGEHKGETRTTEDKNVPQFVPYNALKNAVAGE